MGKATKHCELDIYLKSGIRLNGKFHVNMITSSTVRPSDAICEWDRSFLVLSDVTVHDGQNSHHQDTVLVRTDAMSFIELPPGGWVTVRDEPVDFSVRI